MNRTSCIVHVACGRSAAFRGVVETITLALEDGTEVHLKLTADCCSSSYFEPRCLAEVRALVGQSLVSVENIEPVTVGRAEDVAEPDDRQRGYYKYHAVKITTNRETVVLDWRNESNGYYDGECEIAWGGAPPLSNA